MANNIDILVRLRGAREAAAGADSVAASIHGIGRRATAAAAPLDQTTRATRGLRKATRGATPALGGFTSHLRGMAGIIGAVGIARGLGFATKSAVNLGEEINKTSVVFAGSEQAMIEWSKTTADTLFISQRAALQAAGNFGNMLVPMGVARDKAGDMSRTMVTLAADMASFNNATPQETLDALRSGLAGETEPLRKFGVFLSEARLKQEALNMGLSDGKAPLDAQAKAMATFAIIMKDTTDQQGDAARTADSLAAQQRKVTAKFEEASAKLGAKLIPMLTIVAEQFTILLEDMENGVGIGGALAWTFNAIYDTLSWVVNAVIDARYYLLAFGAVISPVLALLAAYQTHLAVMAAAQKIHAAWTAIQTAATWALNAALYANPIVWIIALIGLLVGAMVLLYLKNENVRKSIDGNWARIREIFGNSIDWIVKKFNGFIRTWGDLGSRLGSAASGVWDWLKTAFKDAMNFIIGLWNSTVGSMSNIKVFGKTITPDMHIPQLANGGLVRGGGTVMVGEAGPEFLTLPRGARVDPLPRAGGVAPVGGNGVINVQTSVFLDGRQVGNAVGRAALAQANRR